MAGRKLLLVVSICAIFANEIRGYKYDPPMCDTIEEHQTLFPAEDPRSFYVCLPDGNPKLVQCESGTVFVNTEDVYGCAPFDLSPCAENYRKIDCSSNADLSTLVQALDPQKYWVCSAPTGVPVELPCPEGKGFVKNATVMGCLPWADWSC